MRVQRQQEVHLHSVVIVPDNDEKVIRLLHPSFFDFITNPLRCQNPTLLVDTKTQHALLAHACLRAMQCLRRNICGIQGLTTLNSEVHDLPGCIQQCLPAHVQYACHHWALHLAQGTISDDHVKLLQRFCLNGLLYWVEVCSLMGDLRSALLALGGAQQALQVCQYFSEQTPITECPFEAEFRFKNV